MIFNTLSSAYFKLLIYRRTLRPCVNEAYHGSDRLLAGLSVGSHFIVEAHVLAQGPCRALYLRF